MWLGITKYGAARYDAGQLVERVAQANRDIAATAKAGRTEKAQAVETQRSSDAIEIARQAGRADALRHVASLRPSAGIHVDLPSLAGAASGVAGAGEATELDDARACADNTVKAEGWQAWWTNVSAIPR